MNCISKVFHNNLLVTKKEKQIEFIYVFIKSSTCPQPNTEMYLLR